MIIGHMSRCASGSRRTRTSASASPMFSRSRRTSPTVIVPSRGADYHSPAGARESINHRWRLAPPTCTTLPAPAAAGAPAQYPRPVGLALRSILELGGHHHRLPPATQRLAQEHLRLPAPVALGGVEVGDAGIEGGVHHGGGLTLVQFGAEVVAPQPDHGYPRSGAPQCACLHGDLREAAGCCDALQ